jgi:hypothetical protein
VENLEMTTKIFFAGNVQLQTMKLLPILILSLLLVSVSSAKQESLTMGPYKVSFDLNTTQEYSINNTIPVQYGETYGGTSYVIYQIIINDSNNSASILVNYFANQMEKDIDTIKSNIESSSYEHNKYDRTYYRTIDGKLGVLGVGENYAEDSPQFYAEYWPMFNVSGDTGIRIFSSYPWDDGTLSLLKTIHVEMVGKPPI